MPAPAEPGIQAETHESAPAGYRDPFQQFRKKRNN
jgi:hypothetical protein